MWPAIGAIGGALIGALGQKDANEKNIDMQRDFAQHGISWKVQDAKEAGLHPLYALGGSGASFTPSAQPLMTAAEGSRLGQDLGRAAAGDDRQRDVNLAQLELIRAQTRESDARAAAVTSAEARAVQGQMASKPLNIRPGGVRLGPYDWEFAGLDDVLAARRRAGIGGGVGVGESPLLGKDTVKFKPDEVTRSISGQPSVAAGDEPAWKRHTINDRGTPLMVPSEKLSEVFENIPFWMWPGVVKKNVDEFGWDWLSNFLPEGPLSIEAQRNIRNYLENSRRRGAPSGSAAPYMAP